MTSSSPPEQAEIAVAPRRARPRGVVLLLPLVPVAVVAIAWLAFGLDRYNSPERIAAAGESLRGDPFALLYVMLVFGVGTLLFIPVTGLVAATALVFEAVPSLAYGMAGILFGATATYWCGRLVGSRALDYLSGPRLDRIKRELCTRAFRASIVARLLPVGNFTVINMLAGSIRVPFRAFFFGNIIGAAPGLIAIALFADQLTAALRAPSARTIGTLAAIVIVLALGGLWLRRVARRREQRATSGGLAS